MICEKCKHEIGPEELKCPYCGADNPFALQHVQNMEQFGQRYEETRSDVVGSAKKTGELAKKAAILAVLIIGIIITNLITNYNYADHDPEDAIRREAEKNAEAYAEEFDGFLERGEYTEGVSFLYAHELMNFQPEEFARFRSVTYVANEYYECIKLMEEMILRSTDEDYYDGLDTDIRNFCMYLESFYKVLEAQGESEKHEKYLIYIEDIGVELNAAMKTYFNMDDDGLDEFLAMSQAQKAVRLEEVLRNE